MRVDVAFFPPTEPPRGLTCLVVDVLRATSSMAVLFGRGVPALYPCDSIEAARQRRADLAGNGIAAFLCGEEGGIAPGGFDYGNSPSELAGAELGGVAVMATTNGTPALLACMEAELTLAAAALNAGAVVQRALEAENDVLVVCAGLRGGYAEDDTLAAGLLVERLVHAGAEPTARAQHALGLFEGAAQDLAGALRGTEHGRRLVGLGFAHDIPYCATVDRYDVTAALRLEAGVPVLRAGAPF